MKAAEASVIVNEKIPVPCGFTEAKPKLDQCMGDSLTQIEPDVLFTVFSLAEPVVQLPPTTLSQCETIL